MRVLILEDDQATAEGLVRGLKHLNPDADFYAFDSLRSAIELLRNGTEIDVALVDLNLVDANGMSAPLEILATSPEVAVVVLTGMKTRVLAKNLLRQGVQDYFVKSEASLDQISHGLNFAMQRQVAFQSLRNAATIDPLTGVMNRKGLDETLAVAANQASRTRLCFVYMFIDLDDFKTINDELGHAVGDEALKIAAQRIRRAIRPSDTVARIGGDEFAVIVTDIRNPADGALVADKIRHLFDAPVEIGGERRKIGCSIGLAIFDPETTSLADIREQADEAMYRSKSDGKGRWNWPAKLAGGH